MPLHRKSFRRTKGQGCIATVRDQPHILILDEPTNYLDRDSLGALADAIERYEGGVIMITHNDAFCRHYVLKDGY